ncbi:MAG TPA: insulinase family protein [Candidatus Baltobacteraceae bacterium]|nr:insulinase family protein [Candidatus Baltobacteraceae bacterium]
MRRARAFAAAGVLAACGAAPLGAAPATTSAQIDGVRAFARPDPGAPLAGIALFVRAGLDRQPGDENGVAALAAQCVLETPVDGVRLADAVDAGGGSVAFAVSAQHVRFFLEAPAGALPRLAALAARALSAPAFDDATLAVARDALGKRIADEGEDPRAVGLQMVHQAYYTGGSGFPPLGEPGALAQLDAGALRAFYARWYVRGGALLASVGQTGAASDAAAASLAAALPAGDAPASAVTVRPYAAQPRQIVARRDLGGPFIVVGYAAPALADKDFAAALVVRAMIEGILEPAVGTGSAPFRPAGVIYGYDAAPAQMAVWINGGRTEPTIALGMLIAAMRSASTRALPASQLTKYVETARGEWALETLSLDERAFAIGNAVLHGLDPDADAEVETAIGAVTAADVERVAKRWFQRFDVALVVPRSTGTGG